MAFFELNIAMSGLFAAQRGLQVTSNNITNGNTTGYSRQVLSQKASNPLSGLSVGMTGTGVTTTGISRLRDSLIDTKLWSQNSDLGQYNTKVTQHSIIESAFGEPSDSGFTSVFNGMFSAISTLSNDPGLNEAKVALKEQMVSFTKYFNNIAGTLEKQQKDLNLEVKASVDEINLLAARIQSLNSQIYEAELYGSEASSFRDERDNCIDRLSQIVDVQVSEEEQKLSGNTVSKMSIKIAGQTLVNHLDVKTLKIQVREDKVNDCDIDGLYDIVWSDGRDFDMTGSSMSGELKGLLDMRDGSGIKTESGEATDKDNTYSGIPYYLNKLNNYVRKFAMAMNEQYSQGKAVGGYALFTYTSDKVSGVPVGAAELMTEVDYEKMTASNFSISKELYEDPYNMRTTLDEENPSDTSFMLGLLSQKDNKQIFNEGNPKDYMIAVFSELGINAKEAEMYSDTYTAITNNLKNQRLSVSQVDTSEEFTYLIQYQQAYQAAAKIMNTIDGIYETTIFKLGNF